MLGTFSQYGVIPQYSAVKIQPDLPLDVAAMVGCGVPTGWGSAVDAADVRPRVRGTHAAADAEEAHLLVQDLTWGVGADKAIVAVGTLDSETVDRAFNAIGKSGTVVLTSMDRKGCRAPGYGLRAVRSTTGRFRIPS
jgi:Zn-dependent alcohol dehydrogenase